MTTEETPSGAGESSPAPDGSVDARIAQALKIVRDEMFDCGCTEGSFLYGCTHRRRRLLAILEGTQNKALCGSGD